MMHLNTASMLRESLPEMLCIAEYCFITRKKNGGCYGYPCAILLFTIADTIGSYYENSSYSVIVGGKSKKIGSDYKHFYIFNSSEYYGQDFTENEIKKLYDNFRSVLNHNLALPPNHTLYIGEQTDPLLKYDRNKHEPWISLAAFIKFSKNVVERFLKEIDLVVPNSKQTENISKKVF